MKDDGWAFYVGRLCIQFLGSDMRWWWKPWFGEATPTASRALFLARMAFWFKRPAAVSGDLNLKSETLRVRVAIECVGDAAVWSVLNKNARRFWSKKADKIIAMVQGPRPLKGKSK